MTHLLRLRGRRILTQWSQKPPAGTSHIVPRASYQMVDPITAMQHTIARLAHEPVIAGPTQENIVTVRPGDGCLTPITCRGAEVWRKHEPFWDESWGGRKDIDEGAGRAVKPPYRSTSSWSVA